MRTGGTTLKTGDQIDTLLDNIASNIDSAIGDSLGTFSFTGLKENAPATLQLFKEMLTQPGFRQDKVELAKTQLRAGISHRNDSSKVIAHREFATLIYGKDAAFGWQPEYDTIGPHHPHRPARSSINDTFSRPTSRSASGAISILPK